MPKRIKPLPLTDLKIISEAAMRATDKHKYRRAEQKVRENLTEFCTYIQNKIATRDYTPSPTRHRREWDAGCKKWRDLDYTNNVTDKTMHWLLILTVQKQMIDRLDPFCVSNVPKRGTHYGAKHIEKWVKTGRADTKYAAEADIRHCFQNVLHAALDAEFTKRVKGDDWLWLFRKILYSFHADEGRGLPVGYITSPWFINFLFAPIDRKMRQKYGVKHMVRNVDDVLMFSQNKRQLRRALMAYNDAIAPMGMFFKPNWQVYRVDYFDKRGKRRGRAADMLGWRFYRDRRILRKRVMLKTSRSARKAGKRAEGVSPKLAMSTICRIGQLKHGDMQQFKRLRVDDICDYKILRRVTSDFSRKQFKTSGA